LGKVLDLSKKVYKPILGGAGDLYKGILGAVGIGGGEKPPKPPIPPAFNQADAAKAAQAAALKKKKAATAAVGFEDLVTSGNAAGLTSGVGSMYQGGKTLTGT
jgi:hypothetical protein